MALLLEFDATCVHRIAQALFDPPQVEDRKDTDAVIAALFASAQRTVTPDVQTGIMKRIALLTTELTVDDVMRRWPTTIRIFLDFNMNCVGCPIATFHSLEEACHEHGVDLSAFFQSLQAATQSSQIPAQLEADRDCPSARPNSM
jgi:hybrid cluster-associated redox disulfide protein